MRSQDKKQRKDQDEFFHGSRTPRLEIQSSGIDAVTEFGGFGTIREDMSKRCAPQVRQRTSTGAWERGRELADNGKAGGQFGHSEF